MSSDRKIPINPNIIAYQGAANVTISNSDYSDYYSNLVGVQATNICGRDSICQPDDDILQTFTFDNITMSLVDNKFVADRANSNVMFLFSQSYRPVKGDIKNNHYVNYENSAFSPLYLIGEPNNQIFLTN